MLKVPGDPLDDVANDVRYGDIHIHHLMGKTHELVIAEDIRRRAQRGDPASASIRYQQMIAETQVAARQPAPAEPVQYCSDAALNND